MGHLYQTARPNPQTQDSGIVPGEEAEDGEECCDMLDMACHCIHELTVAMATYTRPEQDQQEALTSVCGLKNIGKNTELERKCVGGWTGGKWDRGVGSGHEQDMLHTCMKLSENK